MSQVSLEANGPSILSACRVNEVRIEFSSLTGEVVTAGHIYWAQGTASTIQTTAMSREAKGDADDVTFEPTEQSLWAWASTLNKSESVG